jgi:hypothetical protein
LFCAINIFARFEYWIEAGRLNASWRVLWIVPFLRLSVPLESIHRVARFRLYDALRLYRPFGRPFAREGTLVFRSGSRRPIYCSPQSFDAFRSMIESAQRQRAEAPSGSPSGWPAA